MMLYRAALVILETFGVRWLSRTSDGIETTDITINIRGSVRTSAFLIDLGDLLLHESSEWNLPYHIVVRMNLFNTATCC